MSTDELIARYVHAVMEDLPKKDRSDVARELESLIRDQVAERAHNTEPPPETAVVEVLRQVGHPKEVARRYSEPTQHLIGPAYYPAFRAVTAIVLTVLAVLYLFGSVWTLAGASADGAAVLQAFGGLLLGFGETALTNIGILVLVFALLERLAPARAEAADDDWDPKELPAVHDHDRLTRGSQAFELGFDVAAFVIFNAIVFTGIPIIAMADDTLQRYSVGFSASFHELVPWINLTLVLGILLNAILLWRGRWQTWTRLAGIAINVFTLVVLLAVLGLDEIATAEWTDILCRLGTAGLILIVTLDTVQQVARLARSRDREWSTERSAVA